ncbi:hypothetical protein Tco_0825535 [Tanacetum coccineum]
MATLKFAISHNMVAFLDKPTKSDEFKQIVDFLNAHPIKYALMVNPTIYTTCIEQFWTTTKVQTVNGEVQIQALVDKKKVIITETSIRRDLQLADENGTECLPNATIFAELERMGAKTTAWNKFSSTMASTIICFATNKKFNFSKYIFDNMVKNLEGGVKFKMYLSDSTKPIADEAPTDENVTTHSNDPLLSGEERLKLNEMMGLYTNFSQRVLDLDNIKTSQAAEITKLKERVKKLERRNKSRTPRLKRLRKDASKQGRKIADIDVDEDVTLIDETQGRNDDNLMFDTRVLDEQEVKVEKVVSTAKVTTASATTTTVDELTLAQTLIEIKAAKPTAVTTTSTTTKTAVTRPKARGVVVPDPSEFTTTTSPSQTSQIPQAKDKVKAKMVESEKPLKKKDQILIDE